VPVVTLLGRWHGERMSGSVLDALGHGEWATTHEEHYMDAVCGLAADPRLRRQLRRELRPAMLGSKLCDPKDLAVSLESACESMFDLWRKRSS
jgi:predicted O-linked N-acetylglucosamine transferase (SPINDLY family)